MSRASVQGQFPEPKTVLGVLDTQAQIATRNAINVAKHELQIEAPRSDRGGQHIADQVATRVSKTKTGWKGVANWGRTKPHRGVTAAQVVRWVTRGTGIYRSTPGGTKKMIRPKFQRVYRHPMNLGNGIYLWAVRGQHPNQFVDRAKANAHDAALSAMRAGATEAAKILSKGGR